jgi:hypothetical protein
VTLFLCMHVLVPAYVEVSFPAISEQRCFA